MIQSSSIQSSIAIAKGILDKIMNGEDMNMNDIINLIFKVVKNCKISQDFLSSADFTHLIDSFNFIGSSTVDMNDFTYLIQHISDITVIMKLVKIFTIVYNDFLKNSNIILLKNLSVKNSIDNVVNIFNYCILYIIHLDYKQFRQWAIIKDASGITNVNMLFDAMNTLSSYLENADEVKAVITECFTYVKDDLKMKCLHFSKPVVSVNKTKIYVRTLKAQLNKEYLVYQISKKK